MFNHQRFLIFIYCLVNYLLRLYQQIWKYASAQEVITIIESVSISTVVLAMVNFLWDTERVLPMGVIFIGGFLTLGAFTLVRYRWRLVTGLLRRWQAVTGISRRKVLIVGAGEAGQLLARQFKSQPDKYKIEGFVDDDPAKVGMKVQGVKVLGNRNQIPHLVTSEMIDQVVIAIHSISGPEFRNILSICQETNAQTKVLPNVLDMLEDKTGEPAVRDITIEDLLGRQQTEIDITACKGVVCDKVVLVTGAGGSIGSELCTQVVKLDPKLLLMLDDNETALHDLGIKLDIAHRPSLKCLVADILRQEKMENIFHKYRPQIIFHCAAYSTFP